MLIAQLTFHRMCWEKELLGHRILLNYDINALVFVYFGCVSRVFDGFILRNEVFAGHKVAEI